MADAKHLCGIWQSLLFRLALAFNLCSFRRFAQWVTGLALCDEQHTLTQCLTACHLEPQWRNLEAFAEYGCWDLRRVEEHLMRLIQQELRPRWGRYHPCVVDDTKALRNSRHAWGVCTFAHTGQRNHKHPKVMLAHNWLILADLAPGQPWTYLPAASRLYLRKSQLPQGETFQNKLILAMHMLRQLNAQSPDPLLAIFDGGYARGGVVRSCRTEGRPIRFLTRPRHDARLYGPVTPRPPGRRGPKPTWGPRLPAPQHHEQWGVPWRTGRAWIYGRMRSFRFRRLECMWHVSGPDVTVAAYVFQVEGYSRPWYVISDALDLLPDQVAEAYAARYRQEDGIRDQKQQLGMEEVRAWTKQPVLRSFGMQLVAQSLLRLLQRRLEAQGQSTFTAPPWNRHKSRGSIRDLRRLMRRCGPELSQFLQALDEVPQNTPTPSHASPGCPQRRATG